MTVDAQVERRVERRIGQHQIVFMQREGGDQPIQRTFVAHEAYRPAELQGRLQQALHDLLGDHVIDADRQAQRAVRGALLERAEQIAAETEDLAGVTVDETARVARDERAAGADRSSSSQARAMLPVRTTVQKYSRCW